MGHHAAGKINKWNRAGERVIQKKRGFICFEIDWKNFARLQIRDLTRRERNQFANAFMKSGRSAEPQQIRNFGTRVGLEIISVTKFMMRGEEPARVWLDALQRADVVLKIDMPARRVCVFLPLRIRRQ